MWIVVKIMESKIEFSFAYYKVSMMQLNGGMVCDTGKPTNTSFIKRIHFKL